MPSRPRPRLRCSRGRRLFDRYSAESWAATDWLQILALYEMLVRIAPSPVTGVDRIDKAQAAQQCALALTQNQAEQSLLTRRLAEAPW